MRNFGYEAVGITGELAGSISRGIWSQQMIQYPRLQMIVVVDHHEFLTNWVQHKNKIIFQYVKFDDVRTNHWESVSRLEFVNTELRTRISLKELLFLEGKGMQFRLTDPEYIKLKLSYMNDLGT